MRIFCSLLLLVACHYAASFRRPTTATATFLRRRELLEQYLFGGLFGGGKKEVVVPSGTNPSAAGKKPYELEKISNTQKRDWKKESDAIELSKKPAPVLDMQPKSYNFNKANEFPNLYKGWLKTDGDQIAKQMIASTKAAIAGKEKCIEVLFDPVPNLDEVAFGTEWNQRFRKEIVANLKVQEYTTNRGGPSTLEWSTLYWANRLVAGLGQRALIISISGEGLKGKDLPSICKGAQLVSLSDTRRPGFLDGLASSAQKPQLVVLLSPNTQDHYETLRKIGDGLQVPVVALNNPYSWRYDVGGGGAFTLSYVMKRIPKGWIFRRTPGDFEAIIEGPNYEITRVQSFKTQPSLPEISKINQAASAAKYGAAGNDRIWQNRL